MDINNILRGVTCSCGKTHRCDIEHVFIENGAIARLCELCKEYKSILIVADENTYGAAGRQVEEQLSAKQTKKVIFSGKTVVIPNEDAIAAIRKQTEGVDLIVGIGSGVIQDLCKYISFFDKIPYMIVATAPSMDGYASTGAAMILKGMKETVITGLPKAIIADTGVLKNAPLEMIQAGYGDIIGKYSSLCDWKLSTAINGEYFCRYIYDMTYQMTQNTLQTAEGLLKRNEESIRALTEALIGIGIMISFAGSSRPASGSEHHLSHFFEITGIVNNEPYFAHGLDVAYSAIVTTQIREKIIKSSFPNRVFRLPNADYTQKMEALYKTVANGCMALQDKIGNYATDRAALYKEKEEEIKSILAQAPGTEEITHMLSLAGIEIAEFYKLYGREKVNNAIAYAKDLKDRYTVLWLYYDLFGEETVITE